jgi:hypothetical protein
MSAKADIPTLKNRRQFKFINSPFHLLRVIMASFNRLLLLPVVATILVSLAIPLHVTCYAADIAAAKTVRVAAVQFVSEFGKPAENSKGLESLAREAAQNGAKIIVLPEAAIPGYMSHDMQIGRAHV